MASMSKQNYFIDEIQFNEKNSYPNIPRPPQFLRGVNVTNMVWSERMIRMVIAR